MEPDAGRHQISDFRNESRRHAVSHEGPQVIPFSRWISAICTGRFFGIDLKDS